MDCEFASSAINSLVSCGSSSSTHSFSFNITSFYTMLAHFNFNSFFLIPTPPVILFLLLIITPPPPPHKRELVTSPLHILIAVRLVCQRFTHSFHQLRHLGLSFIALLTLVLFLSAVIYHYLAFFSPRFSEHPFADYLRPRDLKNL